MKIAEFLRQNLNVPGFGAASVDLDFTGNRQLTTNRPLTL
jgi:hypothetical protein